MPNQFKICPHCEGKFERKIDGKCPLCSREVKTKQRRCPACSVVFERCLKEGNKRFCPECGVELFYPTGIKMRGQTILAADKETAEIIVSILEDHISHRSNTVFAFEFSERPAELVHAYALIDRSKVYLKKQNGVDVSAHEFTIELIKEVLKDSWWAEHLNSLAMVRNHIGKFAQELYARKKLNNAINGAHKSTFIDYGLFQPREVVWN